MSFSCLKVCNTLPTTAVRSNDSDLNPVILLLIAVRELSTDEYLIRLSMVSALQGLMQVRT